MSTPAPARHLLFTGYPGFLGSAVLPRLLAADDGLVAHCLVQEAWLERARTERAALAPALAARVHLVAGDVTRPGLGLAADALPAAGLAEVWHLAALYDLQAGEAACRRVNVDGTAHVLAFLRALPAPAHLHYVSTCYVSGTHAGVFREEDLNVGQGFFNAYEATKYEAELMVREAMAAGLPATIYRPSIVLGDSATGVTSKFDGPYWVIRMLLRQPAVAVAPVTPGMDTARANLVPRDFVSAAMVALSRLPGAAGRTYQLAHPDPPTARETLRILARATGRRALPVPVPLGLARALLRRSALLRRLLLPPALLDYFTHPVRYDTTHATRDLAGTGITAPNLADYAATLVAFVRAHPEVPSTPMV